MLTSTIFPRSNLFFSSFLSYDSKVVPDEKKKRNQNKYKLKIHISIDSPIFRLLIYPYQTLLPSIREINEKRINNRIAVESLVPYEKKKT